MLVCDSSVLLSVIDCHLFHYTAKFLTSIIISFSFEIINRIDFNMDGLVYFFLSLSRFTAGASMISCRTSGSCVFNAITELNDDRMGKKITIHYFLFYVMSFISVRK